MGNSKEINFILIDYILPIKSGKYRYTTSKVYQWMEYKKILKI